MKWVGSGFVSRTGFAAGAWLWLVFWIYPLRMLLKNLPIRRTWGLLCAVASVVVALRFLNRQTVGMFGERTSAALGPSLFFLASVALVIGVVMYRPATKASTTPTEESLAD